MSEHPQPQQLVEFESLDERSRGALLQHVRRCAACRARWAAEDPSRLFALLTVVPSDEEALARLSAAVERGIDLDTVRRKRGRIYAVASIAASLLLATLVGSFLWDGDVAPPVAPVVAAEAAETKADWTGIELVDSPGEAQLVGLTIGETRVMMIFDEALDL